MGEEVAVGGLQVLAYYLRTSREGRLCLRNRNKTLVRICKS